MMGLPRILSIVLVAGLLLFPFAMLLVFANSWSLPLSMEFIEVAGFTFLQAALSSFFSVVVGSMGALGLLWVMRSMSARGVVLVESCILMPNVAPVLVILLSVMKLFPFSKGLPGIVLVHTLLNAGLVSVSLARSLRDRLGGMAELAWVEGAGRTRFICRVALPFMRGELGLVFLFVFAFCFTSFAVPLMIGGSQGTTIETLIYQKIRISGDWGAALGLATFQMLAVFALSWFLGKPTHFHRPPRPVLSPLLTWKWGVLWVLVAPAVLIAGLVGDFRSGWARVTSMGLLEIEMPRLVLGSFVIAIGTGLLTILMLLLLAFIDPRGWVRRALIGYVAPSSVLMGFALLIAFRETGLATYLKLMVGITLVSVPAFYRLRWDALLASIQGQRVIAWSLGASEWMTFGKLVFPQVIRPACYLAGLAALWAWGDISLSTVVAEKSVTVALLVSNLMGSYRLDAATFLIWVLILGGVITFAFFAGVGFVLGSKPQT